MADGFVDIVNERDQVIGTTTRKEAHEKFLCHRVTSIWFYNDHGEILLQKRSTKKDTFPGTLSISASGHVDSGDTVEKTAVKEIHEETGVTIQFSDLHFLEKKIVAYPPLNHFGNYFAYKFNGAIKSLRFDPEEVEGFEWIKASRLYDARDPIRTQLHPFVTSIEHLGIFMKLLRYMDQPVDEAKLAQGATHLQ